MITLEQWCKDNGKDYILKEFDKDMNKGIQAEGIPYWSKNKVVWKCSVCMKNYNATILNRTKNNTGCPLCSKPNGTSRPEQIIYLLFKDKYPNTENNHKINKTGKREFDIYIPDINLAIEYNGEFFHRNRKNRNAVKQELASNMGITLLIINEYKGKEKKISHGNELWYRYEHDYKKGGLPRILNGWLQNNGFNVQLGNVTAEIENKAIKNCAKRNK